MKKYDNVMMNNAYSWANESCCKRKKVGAIIANEGRTISNGYNGTISGAVNNCEKKCEKCNGKGKLDLDIDCPVCKGQGIITNKDVIHAEANAILFAANRGIPLRGTTLYVTTIPCIECAKMIIPAGIVRVVYAETYHDLSGKKLLLENGIEVEKFSENNF